MKSYIEDRVREVANYLIENNTTIRATGEALQVSRTTVHLDIIERLPLINPRLAKEAMGILEQNKRERHIRGGIATKKSFAERPRNPRSPGNPRTTNRKDDI